MKQIDLSFNEESFSYIMQSISQIKQEETKFNNKKKYISIEKPYFYPGNKFNKFLITNNIFCLENYTETIQLYVIILFYINYAFRLGKDIYPYIIEIQRINGYVKLEKIKN